MRDENLRKLTEIFTFQCEKFRKLTEILALQCEKFRNITEIFPLRCEKFRNITEILALKCEEFRNITEIFSGNTEQRAPKLEGEAMNPAEFGVRLTRLRENQHLSVAELARRLGIDYSQVARYEKGKGFPSLDSAVRLTQVLKVSLDQLVFGTDPPEPPAFRNQRLFDRLRDLDRLPPDRQELALRVLDTVIGGHELEDLAQRLRRS